MRRGYIVEFKRKGFVSWVLGGLLKLFEPQWSGWGWHTAIVYQKVFQGWHLLEATGNGVQINYYSEKFLEANTRNYKWFEHPPSMEQIEIFIGNHLDKRYDVAIYFWTGLAIILRHFWNRRVPKLLDDRFSCWELVSEFCADMGKRLVSKYDIIILPDMLANLEKVK